MVYLGGVATASSQFAIVKPFMLDKNKIILIGITVFLISVFIIMLFWIRRYKKMFKHKIKRGVKKGEKK